MYGFGENKLKTSPGYLSWIIADSSSNNRGLRFRKDLTSKSALAFVVPCGQGVRGSEGRGAGYPSLYLIKSHFLHLFPHLAAYQYSFLNVTFEISSWVTYCIVLTFSRLIEKFCNP